MFFKQFLITVNVIQLSTGHTGRMTTVDFSHQFLDAGHIIEEDGELFEVVETLHSRICTAKKVGNKTVLKNRG